MVGKTSTGLTGAGVVLRGGGELFVTKEGDMVNLNRLNTEGVIQYFRKDGAVRGIISSTSEGIAFGTSLNNGSGIHLKSNAIIPSTSTGGSSDNLHDLGASSSRYKDLYLGGGLYVGGTGTANKLDDYEEGTWTPTYVAGGTNFTSVTYEGQVGKYTKIGDTVILTVKISTNAINKGSASGDVYISGLPFTSNELYSNGTVLYNSANWSGDIPDGWTTFANISIAYLYYKSSTTAVTNINAADMGTGGSANNFIATMIYKTNA